MKGLPMIRFQCPVCNTVMSVPDTDAGRKGDCPKCGQRLQIPPVSPPARRQTMLGKLSRPFTRSRPRVRFDAPDVVASPIPAGPPARLTEAIEHDGQTEPRRRRSVLLFCIGGLVIGLGLGTVATLMLSGGRGHGPANQQSRSTPENAAGPVVNAASKAARMSRQDFRQTVRSFKSINGGRQWDGINQDDGLTGLFFFSKDFHDAFGKPIRTETIGDRAYWYWQCADGVVQVVLHDKLGKMMRSYKDGTINAFEEPGATKLTPGDVAALIAVNDGGDGAPATSRPSGPPPP